MKKNILIFNISGGVGKNIMATAVISSIKKENPDSEIIVSSPWSEVWQNNPDVSEVVNLEHSPEFLGSLIDKPNVKLMFLDPYNDTEHIHKREHLIDTWARLANTKNVDHNTKLFFTETEKTHAKEKILAQFAKKDRDRPLFFIQTSGGATNQPYPISWARDLPMKTAQKIVDKMNGLGFNTIHIRRNDQLKLNNTTWIDFSLREMLCAVSFSDKRLFVDSSAAHAAHALQLKSVVLWVVNDPKVFGYKDNINIEAFSTNREKIEFRHKENAYLDAYNIAGLWDEHPFVDDEIFDTEDIVKKILES